MYDKHCQNLNEIEKAIKIIEKDINNAIRYKRVLEEKIYTKLLCALMVSWLEIRLLKLINEKSDFNNKNSMTIFKDNEIQKILKASSLLDKWLVSLNIAAKKSYKIKLNKNLLIVNNYNNQKTFELKHKLLVKILKNEFSPTINTRNKIDHGQLMYAYKNYPNEFSTENTMELNKINIVSLRCKKAIFKNISNIIHDLTVSKKTFERDFDLYFKKIESYKTDIEKMNYDNYRTKLINKQEKYRKTLSN